MYFSPAFILTCLLASSQAASFTSDNSTSSSSSSLTINGQAVNFKSKVRFASLAKLDCSKMNAEGRFDLKAYLQLFPDQIKELPVECIKGMTTLDASFMLKHGRYDDDQFVGAALGLDMEKNALHQQLAKKIVSSLDGQEKVDDEVLEGCVKIIMHHKDLKALAQTDIVRLKKFLNPSVNVPQAKSAANKSSVDVEKQAEAKVDEWEKAAKEAYENPEDAMHQLAKSALPILEKYGPARGKVEQADDFLALVKKVSSDNAADRKKGVEEGKQKLEEAKKLAEEKAGAIVNNEQNRAIATSLLSRVWTRAAEYLSAKKEEGDAKKQPASK